MGLYAEFCGLRLPTSNSDFFAIQLTTGRKDFLAKSQAGCPVFLLQDLSKEKYKPGLILKNLSVEFHVLCKVQSNSGPLQENFLTVSCDESVPELYELFILCFSAVAQQLSVNADTAEIESKLDDLLYLFRTMSLPNGRAVTGLWAELFVIARSKRIEAALSAWRNTPTDRFDFSWSDQCLEVKSTLGESRIHEFSLEQLQPPSSGRGIIASLLLQRLNGGTSVLDLAVKIEYSVASNSALRKKLWKNIISALGGDFCDKLDTRFDLAFAERNFCAYAMSDIPSLALSNDQRVSSIRFRSDLNAVESTLLINDFEFS